MNTDSGVETHALSESKTLLTVTSGFCVSEERRGHNSAHSGVPPGAHVRRRLHGAHSRGGEAGLSRSFPALESAATAAGEAPAGLQL